MKTGFKIGGVVVILFAISYLLYHFTLGHNLGILAPRGRIAQEELTLIIIAVVTMLLVVIPVLGMSWGFAWKYRASNTHAVYRPEWSNNTGLEIIWWIIPIFIICTIGAIIALSSDELDPFRAIQANRAPMTVQVVALNWKWLFIYPEEGIATVNYLEIPVGTPINFEITADAPMNALWIPQLGGQMYAMPGMHTQLHIIADSVGDYRGSSANFSGDGFSDMHFVVHAVSPEEFAQWSSEVASTSPILNAETYSILAQPSSSHSTTSYGYVVPGLYNRIIMKYMKPHSSSVHSVPMRDMNN